MLKPHGVGTLIDPTLGSELAAMDSIGCGHCGRVVFVKPGHGITTYLIQHRNGQWTEEPGAFCRCCMRPVCLRCDEKGTCTPLEAFIESLEGKTRQLVIAAGG